MDNSVILSYPWSMIPISSQRSFSFLEVLKQEMFAWYSVNKYKIDMNLNWQWEYMILCMKSYILNIYDFIHKIIYIRCSLFNSIHSTVNRVFSTHLYIFQKYMKLCRKKLGWPYCMVYSYTPFLFSHTVGSHIN